MFNFNFPHENEATSRLEFQTFQCGNENWKANWETVRIVISLLFDVFFLLYVF